MCRSYLRTGRGFASPFSFFFHVYPLLSLENMWALWFFIVLYTTGLLKLHQETSHADSERWRSEFWCLHSQRNGPDEAALNYISSFFVAAEDSEGVQPNLANPAFIGFQFCPEFSTNLQRVSSKGWNLFFQLLYGLILFRVRVTPESRGAKFFCVRLEWRSHWAAYSLQLRQDTEPATASVSAKWLEMWMDSTVGVI